MRCQGSYTVEAAWIMALSLSVLTALILVGYQVFYESLLMAESIGDIFDMVTWFRRGAVLSEILQEVK